MDLTKVKQEHKKFKIMVAISAHAVRNSVNVPQNSLCLIKTSNDHNVLILLHQRQEKQQEFHHLLHPNNFSACASQGFIMAQSTSFGKLT